MFTRGLLDNGALGNVSASNAAQAEVASAKNFQQQLTSKAADVGSLAKNMVQLVDDREIWPFLVHDAVSAVATGNTPDALGDDLAALVKAPGAGSARMQTMMRGLSGTYKLNPNGERVIDITMDLEFFGPNREGQLGETVCKWLEDNAKRDAAPYEILNVSSNNGSIANMKVGADGSLASEGSTETSSSSSSGGASGSGEPEGNEPAKPGGSFTVSGGGTGNFGGMAGRRTADSSTTVRRPGGALGGSGGGGSFNAGDTGGGGGEFGGNAQGGSNFQRGTNVEQQKSTLDLDKAAPIPARPGVYPPGSTVYVGKVTFQVKLKGVVPTAAAAVEGQ
jgi:hypothetical protein